jgi:hypothetical protein
LGNKDIVTNTFVNNNDVFADIVNYAVYGGETVVKPEDLMDMDSVVKLFMEATSYSLGEKSARSKKQQAEEIARDLEQQAEESTRNVGWQGEKMARAAKQQAEEASKNAKQQGVKTAKGIKQQGVEVVRDVKKGYVFKSTELAYYAIIAVENQTELHYAMPVRNMLGDALDYSNQVKRIAHENHEKLSGMDNHAKLSDTDNHADLSGVKNYKKISSAEFLSGITKGDKIKPVITITICYSPDKWDAPRSLKEMMCDAPKEIMDMVQDYHINLISPCEIEDFTKFKSEFGPVMKFMTVSKNKTGMRELLESDDVYRDMSSDAADVIRVMANMRMDVTNAAGSNGGVDVCKAWEDYGDDCREEGREEGRREAKEEMRNAWEDYGEDCREEGRRETIEVIIRNMLLSGMKDADIKKIAVCDDAKLNEIRKELVYA